MPDAGGKGEMLRLQSQEDQELSAAAGASQLILKMTSEHQTVDNTNKIMGNDHDVIFVRFRTVVRNGKTQTFKSVEKGIGCEHLRLDMYTCVHTSLVSKITRLYLLSGLPTTFL